MLNIGVLYKYLLARHAERFWDLGEIRIGTLRSYDPEKFGAAIGDSEEGVVKTSQVFESAEVSLSSEHRSWVTETAFPGFPEGLIALEQSVVTVTERAPDCYVYCAAHGFNREAMRAFGADACIEIVDPREFAEILVGRLKESGVIKTPVVVGPCDYGGRRRGLSAPRRIPEMVKNPQYAYQREARILMPPPSDAPIEPFLIQIPELRKHCVRARG